VGRIQYIAVGNRQTLPVTNACRATDETNRCFAKNARIVA